MKKYVKFIELQPWNGVNHTYYLPKDSSALDTLREWCSHYACFDLTTEEADEYTVNAIVVENGNKTVHRVNRVNLPRSRPLEPRDLRDGRAFTLQKVFFRDGAHWVDDSPSERTVNKAFTSVS